ncbi:MAG: Flp pilus assembly complex ATPase component TadA [Oligoflexia bacterium]|nr:Flp pilus assembly complex ATPase component TadA [Oligoflexia bacterium]
MEKMNKQFQEQPQLPQQLSLYSPRALKSIKEFGDRYVEMIISLAGKIYTKALAQAQLLSFRELANLVKLEFIELAGTEAEISAAAILAVTSEGEGALLWEWYQSLCEFKFLHAILSSSEIKEIIFHGNRFMQLEVDGGLRNLEILNWGSDDFENALITFAYRKKISWNYGTPFASFSTVLFGYYFRCTLLHRALNPYQRSKMFLRRLYSVESVKSAFDRSICGGVHDGQSGHGGQDGQQENYGFSFEDFDIELAMAQRLCSYVVQKKNMVIAGATSSGKTTLLGLLLQQIASSEHLVILEDTHELSAERSTVTHLLANSEQLHDYCSYALRLRPDRIILGEIRGAEIVPFFLAMNTGHRGLLCTIHANSAADAIDRLTLLYVIYAMHKEISFKTVEELIRKNVQVIIFMQNRRVGEILEL